MTAIEEVGRQVDLPAVHAMRELFAPLHLARSYQAPKIEGDVTYGPHERHRLDVHTAGGPGPKPVLLFVHGGFFVAGDKSTPGSPYYDHIGGWAVDGGMVGVNMTYRLAPEHQWPSGADDVEAAVGWVHDNIADHGGDPDRIVLVGHSAGATHIASYLGRGGGGVVAAALLSGIYDLGTVEPDERSTAYFGSDPDSRQKRSPLPGLLASKVPMLFSVAEWDPLDFHRQAATVIDAWVTRDGVLPPFIWAQGHNHISEIVSIGVDETLGAPLRRFIDVNI